MAVATSNVMNKFYKGGYAPKLSVSMLKETIALLGDYVSETSTSRTSRNYIHFINPIFLELKRNAPS